MPASCLAVWTALEAQLLTDRGSVGGLLPVPRDQGMVAVWGLDKVHLRAGEPALPGDGRGPLHRCQVTAVVNESAYCHTTEANKRPYGGTQSRPYGRTDRRPMPED